MSYHEQQVGGPGSSFYNTISSAETDGFVGIFISYQTLTVIEVVPNFFCGEANFTRRPTISDFN